MHSNYEDRELVRGLFSGGCADFSKLGFFPVFFFSMFLLHMMQVYLLKMNSLLPF